MGVEPPPPPPHFPRVRFPLVPGPPLRVPAPAGRSEAPSAAGGPPGPPPRPGRLAWRPAPRGPGWEKRAAPTLSSLSFYILQQGHPAGGRAWREVTVGEQRCLPSYPPSSFLPFRVFLLFNAPQDRHYFSLKRKKAPKGIAIVTFHYPPPGAPGETSSSIPIPVWTAGFPVFALPPPPERGAQSYSLLGSGRRGCGSL